MNWILVKTYGEQRKKYNKSKIRFTIMKRRHSSIRSRNSQRGMTELVKRYQKNPFNLPNSLKKLSNELIISKTFDRKNMKVMGNYRTPGPPGPPDFQTFCHPCKNLFMSSCTLFWDITYFGMIHKILG